MSEIQLDMMDHNFNDIDVLRHEYALNRERKRQARSKKSGRKKIEVLTLSNDEANQVEVFGLQSKRNSFNRESIHGINEGGWHNNKEINFLVRNSLNELFRFSIKTNVIEKVRLDGEGCSDYGAFIIVDHYDDELPERIKWSGGLSLNKFTLMGKPASECKSSDLIEFALIEAELFYSEYDDNWRNYKPVVDAEFSLYI